MSEEVEERFNKSQFSFKNLENVDFMNKRERVGSPHSLEALKLLGLKPSDLYYLTFNEFLDQNIELKFVDKELQQRKYAHHEERRRSKISKALVQRSKLMENRDTIPQFSKFSKTTKMFSSDISKFSVGKSQSDLKFSTVVEQEKQKLEKIKQKTNSELEGMIDYEFYLEDIRIKNEKRMQEQKEKDERKQQEKKEMQMERARKAEMKEEERQRKLKAELDERERKYQERKEFEERVKMLEEKKRELDEIDNKVKLMEKRKNEENFRKQVDSMYQKQHDELVAKQNVLDEKDKVRKRLMEDKRKETALKYQQISIENKQKIEKTLVRNEEKIVQKREAYEDKQAILERIKQNFLQKKERQLYELKLKIKHKEEEIEKVLEKNQSNEKKKIENYNYKQKLLEIRNIGKEKEKKQQVYMKTLEKQRNEQKIMDTKSKYNEMNEQYKNKLLNHLDNVNFRIKRTQSLNSHNWKQKFIRNTLKRDDHQDNLNRYEMLQEYKRERKLNSIMDRLGRIDDIQNQRMMFAEESRRVRDEMKRKKEYMMEQYTKLMRKGNISKDEFKSKLLGNELSGSKTSHNKTRQHQYTKSVSNFNDLRGSLESQFSNPNYNSERAETDSRQIKLTKHENYEKGHKQADAEYDFEEINNKFDKDDIDKEVAKFKKDEKQRFYDSQTKQRLNEAKLEKEIAKLKEEMADNEVIKEKEEKLQRVIDENKLETKNMKEAIASNVEEYRQKLMEEL